MPRAFITGSLAYGTPSDDSDVDLVVLVTPEDKMTLLPFADNGAEVEYGDRQTSFRFGRLNLIACSSRAQWECWKFGTDELKGKRPVSREDAIALFQKLRAQAEQD